MSNSFRLIRFLFFSFLFNKLRTSNLFEFACQGLRLFGSGLFKLQIEPGEEVRSSDNPDKIDEFTLITGSDRNLISEIEYERIISMIKQLKNQILNVNRSSDSIKIEIIERIEGWRDDPINRFALPWKEHFEVLTEIFRVRGNQFYVSNSITKEYFEFIFENILIPSKGKGSIKHSEILDKIVGLLTLMMKNVNNIIFIDLILKEVRNDLSKHQILTLFNDFHQVLPHYAQSLKRMDGKYKQKGFLSILTIYLKFFNHFHVQNSRNIYALKQCNPVPSIFKTFFELLPIYHALISENLNFLKNFRSIYNLRCHESLGIINFYLKQTDFNNVFNHSIQRVSNKINIFKMVKDVLFPDFNLFSILNYCLDKKLMFLFEFLLNFSENDTEFIETCYDLIERFMTNKRYEIDVYSAVLAVCPKMTMNDFDNILIKLLDVNPGRNDLNVQEIRGFRRILAAVDNISISNHPTWQMSESLINLIESDPFDAHDHYLYHSARIYLYRRFGIPFTCTTFEADTAEDVDWVEVIGFANFFLEKEGVKAEMIRSDVPKIFTTEKEQFF
jgi:hypothetical protein